MPNISKIRTLRALACQTVDLSFNMPGVIARQNFDPSSRKGLAQLGSRITTFDMNTEVYDRLDEKLGDNEKLAYFKYNSASITYLLSKRTPSPYLYALRNEALANSLDQVIERRASAFFDKYIHKEKLKTLMETYVPKSQASLSELTKIIDQRFKQIEKAYQDEGLNGVQKETLTRTKFPTSTTSTDNTAVAMVSSVFNEAGPVDSKVETTVYEGDTSEILQIQSMPKTGSSPMINTDQGWKPPLPGEKIESSISTSTVEKEQEMYVGNNSFSHPLLENKLQKEQFLVGLYQELINNYTTGYRVPYLDKIMDGELASIDADVRALQLNFAHTYLTSPIAGVITALYKDVGEAVEPGEPIIRIENDAYLLLVGQIQNRFPIRIGQKVKLSAKLHESEESKPLYGQVKAIRGHESDSDEWEVIIEVANLEDPKNQGEYLIPLSYQFDPDRDQLEIL